MKLEGYLLDADYIIEGDEPIVRLFLRTEEGPAVAYYRGFEPYFYVVPEEGAAEELKDRLEELSFEDAGDRVEVVGIEERELTYYKEEVLAFAVKVKIPPHVPKVKDVVKDWEEVRRIFEFDIPFYKRFLVNKGLKPPSLVEVEGEESEPVRFDSENTATTLHLEATKVAQGDERDIFDSNCLAFDLEVYEDEVIMCSFYSEGFEKVLAIERDGFSVEYVETVKDEESLLRRVMEVVEERDPDYLLGYNTDEFDFDVLRERCQEYGLELKMGRLNDRMKFQRRGRFSGARLKGRVHLDLYAFVATVISMTMQSETLTLDAVAEELLGENKEEMDWEDIKEAWREGRDLDLLAKYALRDSELTYRLGESLVPQITSISTLVGLTPFDTCRTSYGQLVENFLIRQAYEQDIIAPNRPVQSRIGQRRSQGAYAGGFVYEPEKGLHENIALFDFRSLYPTIIVAHNISPDTLEVEGCEDKFEVEIEEVGRMYEFCQDERGFIPEILRRLVGERYEIKDRLASLEEGSQAYRNRYSRQFALKILANAFYGYLGYSSARWYSRECAEATTFLGRDYIHRTIDKAEDMGFEVVYGDTDSVMLKAVDVEERAGEFLAAVNEELPEFMELELEGLFTRGLFTYTESGKGAKKKYALLGRDGKVNITGFEQVRRDWSKIAKDTQERVIREVLEGDVEAAVETVKKTVARLKEGKVPVEELRIYTRLTKKPESYKSTAPHVEAVKKAVKRGVEIKPGAVIDYVVTSGGGTISDRSELTRFAEDYDPQYYIDNQVIPVALRVLKVFGYTEGQLKGKGKQSGLGKFTGGDA